MENCKNCFLAASCAATADPKITDEERKLVDTALIAQYSDEKIKKELYFIDAVLGVIRNVKTPMLMYDGEKEVVRKALLKYKDEIKNNVIASRATDEELKAALEEIEK